jgi:hypothetical protein
MPNIAHLDPGALVLEGIANGEVGPSSGSDKPVFPNIDEVQFSEISQKNMLEAADGKSDR